MRRFTQRFCQQHFFLLTFAVCFNFLFELLSLQPQFVKHGEEERGVHATVQCKLGQCPVKMRGILRDIGDTQSCCNGYFPGMGNVFSEDQADQTGFATSVLPGQGDAAAGTDLH